MQPIPVFTIASIGICFFIMWNVSYTTESRVARVDIGRKHIMVKVAKRYKNSHNARRAMIVRCCGRRKCSQTRSRIKKNGTASLRVAKIVRNELNGPSHRIVAIGNKKYMFPPEKATFDEAKKICEDQGLEISSVSGNQESKSIDDYLNYIGLGSEPLFSSLPAESTDLNWGAGTPPGGPGECLTQFKGAFYNSSCDQPSQFSCQEKPGATSDGTNLLSSIGDAVLNFVGGKNIIAPSERANVPKAASMCKDQGMDLMSLDSLTQLSSVQSFLGGIGLSSSTLLTSLKKETSDSSNNWLGDLASALLPPPANPADAGDCMGISSLGLLGVSCDMVSNFVCQAPPPKLISDTGEELPFSKDLLDMATSLGIGTSMEPAVPAKVDKPTKPSSRKPLGQVSKPPVNNPGFVATTDAYIEVNVPEPATDTPNNNDVITDVANVVTNVLSAAPTIKATLPAAIPGYANSGISGANPSANNADSKTTTTTPPPLSFNVSAYGKDFFSPNISLPFSKASAYCENISMQLVILEFFEKFQFFYNLSGVNSGRENQSFYTGFSKNNSRNITFFGDKYASDALNATGDGLCLVLAKDSYNVTSCNESRAFICETQDPNISGGSDLNYTIFKNYAVDLLNQYTFYEAARFCISQNLSLAVINQRFELFGELKYFIYDMGMDDVPFYISVENLKGEFLKKLDWAPGQPDSSLGCVAYLNYTLTSINCNTVTYAFCENTTSSTYRYPVTVKLAGENYLISYASIMPIDGDIYCQSFGKEMVSIELSVEFKAIVGAIKNSGFTSAKIAIDLQRQANSTFEWGSGADFDPTTIGLTNMSAAKGTGDCGALYQSTFTLVDCFYPAQVLCEDSKDFGDFVLLTDPKYPNHTYKFFNVTNTYDGAKNYCKSYGSNMIELDSDSELKNVVVPLLTNKTFANMDFYISSELIGSNAASWVNSANLGWLTYGDFNIQFYPPRTCLISCNSGTAFYASICDVQRYFLCEDSFTPEVTTVGSRPTTFDSSYYKTNSLGMSAYFLSTSTGYNYQDARVRCQKFSSDLVVIESQAESDFLDKWLSSISSDSSKIYIGLNQIDRPDISFWINNVSVSFSAFANGDKKDKKCVILNKSKWTTTNCDDKGPTYMCETNNSTVPTV